MLRGLNGFEDHPRVCGEHVADAARAQWLRGSSPRVRGTPYGYGRFDDISGIIPACAGNTKMTESNVQPFEGSSPRVRGTLEQPVLAGLHAGIIPACAGNTFVVLSLHIYSRDHPRVCGEHQRRQGNSLLGRGSSPRVRGTLAWLLSVHGASGIIPACAGNTWQIGGSDMGVRDHPRVCGEHHDGPHVRGRHCGSSPRVRGTRFLRSVESGPPGIIPACAGNTTAMTWSSPAPRDHPRVCGEHVF